MEAEEWQIIEMTVVWADRSLELVECFLHIFSEAVSIARLLMTRDIISQSQVGSPSYSFLLYPSSCCHG